MPEADNVMPVLYDELHDPPLARIWYWYSTTGQPLGVAASQVKASVVRVAAEKLGTVESVGAVLSVVAVSTALHAPSPYALTARISYVRCWLGTRPESAYVKPVPRTRCDAPPMRMW